MEKYKININNLVRNEQVLVSWEGGIANLSYNDGFVLTTTKRMEIGDKLELRKFLQDGVASPVIDNMTVISVNENRYGLEIESYYYNISNFDGEKKVLVFNVPFGIYPEDKNVGIKIFDDNKTIWVDRYNYLNSQTMMGLDETDYDPRFLALDRIVCYNMSEEDIEYLEMNYPRMLCELYSTKHENKPINRFFYVDTQDFVRFWKNSRLSKWSDSIMLPLHLTTDDSANLNEEGNVLDTFVNTVRANIVPEIIDYEKVAYRPAYLQNGNIIDISELNFNFHFRERVKEGNEYAEGWYTSGSCDWNGIQSGVSVDTQTLRKSDLLGYLNFNNDDVHYQQNKIKKSFVRLSFYDSNNPLAQQLLAYSTIFLDSTELAGKFIKNRNQDPNFGVFTDNTPNSDNSNRIDTRLVIYDNFNTTKSSEGFYIYLFKDEVSKNNPFKDIYMKVEFNHAGYGRTLPFIKPYPGGNIIRPVPYEDYFEYMFIKLTLKYIDTEKKYVYTLGEDEKTVGTYVDTANNRIIFNLFEPKLSS